MGKVVISMSGGLDSTCLALYELSEGCEVRAYAFDYGQKHSIELKKLRNNIEFLQKKNLPITLQVINLKDVFSESQSSLCGVGEVPKGQYENSNMASTVVENRNVIFSSIIYAKALGWAKQADSEVSITLGIHAGDHCLYPDTTPESQSMARELFRISNWGSDKVDYIAPFVNVSKGEVLKMGLNAMKNMEFSDADIEEVLRNTHTCYSPNENGESCGECGSCMERADAFKYCDMKDPISFAKPIIKTIKEAVEDVVDVVKESVEDVAEIVEGAIEEVTDTIKDAVGDVIDVVKETVGIEDTAKEAVDDVTEPDTEPTIDVVEELVDNVTETDTPDTEPTIDVVEEVVEEIPKPKKKSSKKS